MSEIETEDFPIQLPVVEDSGDDSDNVVVKRKKTKSKKQQPDEKTPTKKRKSKKQQQNDDSEKKPTKKRKSKKQQQSNDDNEEEENDDGSKKKKRVTRKTKYPLVTVQCRNAYQFYIREKALENKRANGEPKSAADYGADWVNETDKSKWEELARLDLENFKKEVEAKGYTYEEPVEKKKKKTPSAFILFANANSKTVQEENGVNHQQALPILGDMWRNKISAEEKQTYIDEAARQKAAHEKECGEVDNN